MSDIDPTTDSNEGTLFALGFFGNIRSFREEANANLYISTRNPGGAQATVSLPNRNLPGFPQTLDIIAGRTQVVSFPVNINGDDIRVNGPDPENRLKGILVTSDQQINVIGVNDDLVSTDGFLVLPCKSFKPANRSSNLVLW